MTAENECGQVVPMLRQIRTPMPQGNSVAFSCKQVGVTERDRYLRRKEYGGLKVD